MKPDFIEVDCINDAEEDSHTSADIDQSHIVVPSMDRYLSSVVEIVRFAIQQDPQGKIVAFFPTARTVAFMAEFFNEGLKIPVLELHSKKTQSHRNRVSDEFRAASSSILFTSDVSARGVDYPGVTHVIQFERLNYGSNQFHFILLSFHRVRCRPFHFEPRYGSRSTVCSNALTLQVHDPCQI